MSDAKSRWVVLVVLLGMGACKVGGGTLRPASLMPIGQPARDPDPHRPPEVAIWSGWEYQQWRAERMGPEPRPPGLEQAERLLAVVFAYLAGGYLPILEWVFER